MNGAVAEAREIAAAAAGRRVEVVEGAGHFVSLQAPERFNPLLAEFLARWK